VETLCGASVLGALETQALALKQQQQVVGALGERERTLPFFCV
jgi:hypothetical protein